MGGHGLDSLIKSREKLLNSVHAAVNVWVPFSVGEVLH